MSGYAVCKWTCGECGDSFQADGVVGDWKVNRWMIDHKERHRIAKMSTEDRMAHYRRKAAAQLAGLKLERKWQDDASGT